jgi:hypothetical protein
MRLEDIPPSEIFRAGNVHFMHGQSRRTPCEKALMARPNAGSFTLKTAEVTCPRCLVHYIFLDAIAQQAEDALSK